VKREGIGAKKRVGEIFKKKLEMQRSKHESIRHNVKE
jgi:hypothetical protein